MDRFATHDAALTFVAIAVLAAAIAALAAVRRADRRRAYIRALERLQESSVAIAASSSAGDELIDRLAASARELIDVPISRIVLLEPDGQTMRIIQTTASDADNAALRARTHFRADEAPGTLECIRSGCSRFVRDVRREPGGFNGELLQRLGIGSLMVMPLPGQNGSMGAMVFADSGPRRFTDDEIRLARLYAASASVSITNARLRAGMEEGIASLHRANAQRDTLYAISSELQRVHSIEEVLARIVDLAPLALGFDRCMVCRGIDGSDGNVRIAAVTRATADGVPLASGDIVHCPHSYRVMRSGEAIVVANAAMHASLCGVRLGDDPVGSALYVPLVDRTTGSIGSLVLMRRAVGPLGDDTVKLAGFFASRAAIALENARLHEQSRHDAQTQATLLRELNHRVKNNLAGIVGLLSMGTPSMPPEARHWLGRVTERIGAMAHAHDLLHTGRKVHLSALIRATLDSIGAIKPDAVRVRLQADPAADALLPAEQTVPLAIVIHELAYNAIVHGLGQGGELCIQLRRASDGQIAIDVIDDGARHSSKLDVATCTACDQAAPCEYGVVRGDCVDGDTAAIAVPARPLSWASMHSSSGVGLNLVRGLVARELRGVFELKGCSLTGGTVASVVFPLTTTPDTGWTI